MIELVGRVIVRGAQVGKRRKADLALLCCGKNQKVFKPDHVYNLFSIDGELILKDVGKTHVCWGRDVSTILRDGKEVFLTKDELDHLEDR